MKHFCIGMHRKPDKARTRYVATSSIDPTIMIEVLTNPKRFSLNSPDMLIYTSDTEIADLLRRKFILTPRK